MPEGKARFALPIELSKKRTFPGNRGPVSGEAWAVYIGRIELGNGDFTRPHRFLLCNKGWLVSGYVVQ